LTPLGCRLFHRSDDIAEGTFVERPNRFVVRADLGGALVDAHCPNPGRLLEIFVPGTPLILKKRGDSPQKRSANQPRLGYTLLAARHRGILVPIPSTWANDLAERIVLPALFPDASTIRREVSLGATRLDFLLQFDPRREGRAPTAFPARELYLEVKNCSLIEEGTAMFPDAPTLRGLKHLGTLESLAAEGRPEEGPRAGVLFLIMNPRARRFLPNLHTDPAFTRRLIGLQGKIRMHAVSIRVAEDGTAALADPEVPIDLAAAAAVHRDSGAYLLVVKVRQQGRLSVGSLGEIEIAAGWYVYVGSGRRGLNSRIERHHRRRKRLHWHIDHLLARVQTGDVVSLPIRSLHDLECSLARVVAALAVGSIPGFGSSDCPCPSHLFFFDHHPLEDRRFLDLLFHYRHTLALARSSWAAMSSASQG
jgi:sugar fermentation stimulation protein A